MERNWWVISIGGYGTFAYFGTEEEAEEMRAHKSNWERGVGSKKRAERDDINVLRQVEHVRYEIANEYPFDERGKAERAEVRKHFPTTPQPRTP